MIRAADILLSITALIILMPLFLIVAIALRFTGEGEILFYQERVGKHGQRFFLIKFATMLKDSPNIGTKDLTVKNDPRILALGGWLRHTKINELPQLINVLFGDMSLIGPRPQTPGSLSHYNDVELRLLTENTPGLSGVGSIVFRDEENILEGNDSLEFYQLVISPYKLELEQWFNVNRSVFVYLALLFLTCWVILVPKTTLVRSVFPSLPEPPEQLKGLIS